ncbi:MAG TPA: tetratricopeptide repeat protein, partial [Tepidisphaeraceae bacterium]
ESRRQGIQQIAENNYAEAAGSFRNAARQDPRDYRSLYYLGTCYEKTNQYHQAIEAYKSSLDAQTRTLAGQEDEAGRLRTMDALASLVGKADSRDGEVNLIEQKAKTGNSSRDWYLLAKIYRYRGDADSSNDAYNRAVIRDPKDFSLIKEYGLYLVQLGQNDRAQRPLRKAYTMKPDDVEVLTALRNIGIVPGPALKDEKQLVSPVVPKGPIPPVSELKIPGLGGGASSTPTDTAQPAGASQTVQAPKD